jgi:hypothetical protein
MAIVLLDCHGQLRIIGKKVNITLYDEVLKFVDQLAKNRSSFINDVLWKEKRRIFMEKLEDAYKEQANDPDFQKEISVWDVTVGDGLD